MHCFVASKLSSVFNEKNEEIRRNRMNCNLITSVHMSINILHRVTKISPLQIQSQRIKQRYFKSFLLVLILIILFLLFLLNSFLSATKRSRNFLFFDRLIPVEYDKTKIFDKFEFLLRKRGHFSCSFWCQGRVIRGTGNESPSTSYREVTFPFNKGRRSEQQSTNS